MKSQRLAIVALVLLGVVGLIHAGMPAQKVQSELKQYEAVTQQAGLTQSVQQQLAPVAIPPVSAAVVGLRGPGIARFDIYCGSWGSRYTTCYTGLLVIKVLGVSQMSRKPCIKRQSWGHDSSNIWVDRGCRATFHVIGLKL